MTEHINASSAFSRRCNTVSLYLPLSIHYVAIIHKKTPLYTVSQKNIPDIFDCNLKTKPINRFG